MARLTEIYLRLMALVASEDGQDLAEYSLLLALLAVGLFAIVTLLGGRIDGVYVLTVNLLDRTMSVAA